MPLAPDTQVRNFFIVGVAKCGTSALHEYLRRHPKIAMSAPKETHYFESHGTGSFDDYFEFTDKTEIKGEASPQYFIKPDAARRIKDYDPESKIIIITRNPISRAYSHYTYLFANFKERRPFIEVIKDDYDKYKSRDVQSASFYTIYNNCIWSGMYHEFIPMWEEMFGTENVLVLSFEDFFSNVEEKIQDVFRFLEVDEVKIGGVGIVNRTKSVRHLLLHRLTFSPIIRTLRRLPYRMKVPFIQMIVSDDPPPPMNKKEMQMLEGIFGNLD